ncbi:MAG: toll/interleukin-1 receptor domain-containing protein, partial [Acetobacteraceae bacterium]|nr:toll/interleukin-1 receptor domain-containing protein [Acetobacteraceae bacterium]
MKQLPPGQAARIFISYARSDGEDVAREVLRLAEEHNPPLAAWLDHEGLEGGEDWWRQAAAAIDGAEHLVLVLTPAALASENCEKEWSYARERGVQVSPVKGVARLDDAAMPRWMRAAHRFNLNIPEHRVRLLRGLEGPPSTRQVPFMAPLDDEGRFIERPAELGELIELLLNSSGDPVAITAALRGAGGFGKTALAARLCRGDVIRDAFYDGILWTTLGEKPGDPVAALADLAKELTGESPGVTTLDAAKNALAKALDNRKCLLVIDDAWSRGDLEPFLHRGPHDQTARLVTTRDDRVLGESIRRVPVDAMRPSESGALLQRGLGDAAGLSARLDALAERLGHWPLLLELANGVLRNDTALGQSVEDALTDLENSLTLFGLTGALRSDHDEDRRRSADGTLTISMSRLSSDGERDRYRSLGIFAEDAEITLASAAALWKCHPIDTKNTCKRLYALSLLRDLDLGRGILRLHDVFRLILQEQLGEGRLAEL